MQIFPSELEVHVVLRLPPKYIPSCVSIATFLYTLE